MTRPILLSWLGLSSVPVFALALLGCSVPLRTSADGASGADSGGLEVGGTGTGGIDASQLDAATQSSPDGANPRSICPPGTFGGFRKYFCYDRTLYASAVACAAGGECNCSAGYIAFCPNGCVELPDETASCKGPGESQDGGMSETARPSADGAVDSGGTDTGAHSVVSMVALGHTSSCAVVDGAVRCWGWNGYGQLGDGTTKSKSLPVQVQGLTAGATAVAVGLGHACAVVHGGAECWGWNIEGQLGNGTTSDSLTPVQVSGLTSGVTSIAAGATQIGTGRNDTHVCAVVDGAVVCWGNNLSGQLGNNTTVSSSVPVQVQGISSGATAIAVSDSHSCAIVNGSALCWGSNGGGQLGDGTTTKSSVPVQVHGLTSGVTAISTGSGFTCAVVNGGVQCWGGNGLYSTLGSAVTSSYVPIPCDGMTSGVSAVSAGYIYGCALIDGAVRCWGDWNPLYESAHVGQSSLVQVPNLPARATAIATADTHACAIVDSRLQCWGNNLSGGLGNGSTEDSRVPVEVILP